LSHRASVEREAIDRLQTRADNLFITELDAIADVLGVDLEHLIDDCEQPLVNSEESELDDYAATSFAKMRSTQAIQEWRRKTIRLKVKRAALRRARLVAERDTILNSALRCCV